MTTFTQQERERLCALSLEVDDAARDVAPALTGKRLTEIARQVHELAHSVSEGRCSGCGQHFKGERGLRSHQTTKFVTLACRKHVGGAE